MEDLFEGIKDKIEKKAGFKDWLKTIKEEMTGKPGGPFFLGGDRPFKYNPGFIPQAPIPDALKVRIFNLIASNPDQWTPRKLSAHFKVAIPRIKAIIKMKKMEAKMVAEGKFIVNEEYVKKMEEALGAKASVKVEAEPVLDNSIVGHLRPKFVAMPENSPPLTFEDAARLLGKSGKGKGPGFPQTIAEEEETPCIVHGKFIKFDEYERSRHKFLFVDRTEGVKPSQRTVLVREPNGDLRTGTKAERLFAARKVWARSARHFLG